MKTRLLKITLSFAMLFIAAGAFAQENVPWTDMSASGVRDSVIVNGTLPYYVEPDPILNDLTETYDPSTPMADQDITSTFSWTTESGTAVTFNDPSTDGADAPYQTVTFPGSEEEGIQIGVQEVNDCGSGDIETVTVDVIPEPSFTVNGGSQNLEVCDGGQGNINIASIADDQISGESNYKFLVEIDKQMVEADGTEISGTDNRNNSDSVINVTTADGTGGITVLENYTFYVGNDGTDDRITEYTFDFDNTNGTYTGGINHHISRKSDYMDFSDAGDGISKTRPQTVDEATQAEEYTWFAADGSDNTVTVTVFPEPTTGTIYYVPNDFDQ